MMAILNRAYNLGGLGNGYRQCARLFDNLVAPILIYGCEGWRTKHHDSLEKTLLKFFKSVFGVPCSATPDAVLEALGTVWIRFVQCSKGSGAL